MRGGTLGQRERLLALVLLVRGGPDPLLLEKDVSNSVARSTMGNRASRSPSFVAHFAGSTAITTGRVTMQRSSKGVISIAEVDNGGRYVTLENTSTSRMKRVS